MRPNPRLYNLVAINEREGFRVLLNSSPLTQKQASTMRSKCSQHPARRLVLEEANAHRGGNPS